MLQLVFPLFTPNSRTLGLIQRGTRYFEQDNITIILPGNTWRISWQHRRPSFGGLEAQKVSYVSFFQSVAPASGISGVPQ